MNIPFTIEQAKVVAAEGDSTTAIALLREVVKQEPRNVDAWLALADIVEKPEQVQQCLERVLQIDPNNQIARQKLLPEQPNDLDFLFETVDEPAQEPVQETDPEPGDSQTAFPALDFSNLYVQEDQPPRGIPEQNPPNQTFSEQSQAQDIFTPSIQSSFPDDEVARQQPTPRQTPVTKKEVQGKGRGLSGIEITLIVIIGFICLCMSVFGVAYIGSSGVLNPGPTSLPEEITAVIFENIRASNAKDFDGYMATIHSKSPGYNTTKETIETAFSDQFNLSYWVSDVYIIEQKRNEAVAHFVLTTRLASGSIAFRDNQVTGEMTLRKEDGNWKIYDQKVIEVKYLD